jgi:cytochrome d ubiquinol oxidase subunit II
MTDGYDLGLSSLLFFISPTESDRRQAINTMSPFWDGNEVWIVAAGGMTFAVFPPVYASLFSSLYGPMLLVLFGLIFRDVAFEFRHKQTGGGRKWFWDLALVVGSFVPTFLLGVLFANLFRGMPIDAEGQLQGGLVTILSPYALLGGVLFFVMFALHGLIWLGVKTEGPLHDRATAWAKKFWVAMLVILVIFLAASYFQTRLYDNYLRYYSLLILPTIAVLCLLLVRIFLAHGSGWKAFFASACMILFITLTTLAGLYPNLVPSTLNPSYSLTIRNASSSPLTLKVMLIITLIFIPFIILYQSWAHYVFRNKVTETEVSSSKESY